MALNQTREHSLLGILQNDIFGLDLAFESKTATTVKQAVYEAESVKCVKGVEMLEIKEAEVLQHLEIMVTGKNNPYYVPGFAVCFCGVEFVVQENKCAETINSKSQRIKLMFKI